MQIKWTYDIVLGVKVSLRVGYVGGPGEVAYPVELCRYDAGPDARM